MKHKKSRPAERLFIIGTSFGKGYILYADYLFLLLPFVELQRSRLSCESYPDEFYGIFYIFRESAPLVDMVGVLLTGIWDLKLSERNEFPASKFMNGVLRIRNIGIGGFSA